MSRLLTHPSSPLLLCSFADVIFLQSSRQCLVVLVSLSALDSCHGSTACINVNQSCRKEARSY